MFRWMSKRNNKDQFGSLFELVVYIKVKIDELLDYLKVPSRTLVKAALEYMSDNEAAHNEIGKNVVIYNKDGIIINAGIHAGHGTILDTSNRNGELEFTVKKYIVLQNQNGEEMIALEDGMYARFR